MNYLAQFNTSGGDFFVAALEWDAPAGPLMPGAWWSLLRKAAGVDVGLRLSGGEEPRVLLLLTGDRAEALKALVDALEAAGGPEGLKQPQDAQAFDHMTSATLPPEQLRVHHAGYHYGGQALGCDFRLYAAWAGQGLPEGVMYQVALRATRPGPEDERRVRKYQAWLELERPFTPAVCAVEALISRRLLGPGWLADEYLMFADAALREAWEARIRTQFAETTGKIGFREAPIEAGDFSDWLATGCHTARDDAQAQALPVEAACTFSEDEAAWLMRQNLTAVGDAAGAGAGEGAPEVFISYASSDFAKADALRHQLETEGMRCWIAPRDINSGGLPYTQAITQAIEQVRAVVVVLSPSANLSVHIPREIDLALERKLMIVPVRFANLLPEGQLKYLLRTCQWLDAFDREYGDAVGELLGRLGRSGL